MIPSTASCSTYAHGLSVDMHRAESVAGARAPGRRSTETARKMARVLISASMSAMVGHGTGMATSEYRVVGDGLEWLVTCRY